MRSYFEYQHFVTFADTNLVGNVYFANYLAWQGACRERFLAERAPSVASRLTTDLVLVTLSCSCEFFSEVYALDRVSVRMSLAGTTGSTIAMRFGYYRVNRGPAQLVARGGQEVACMTRRDGELIPIEIPGELASALASYAVAGTG
ncbi:MAG TPA: acyl-CoA thioesterase [Streptosporangiaceae bacterium]|nr:acyl-CoA thioesterase [Streptosporangiaceae bacterium]